MPAIPYPTVAITLVLMVTLFLIYRKNTKKQHKDIDDFWEREREADTAPMQDISGLPYIKVPLDTFPIGFSDDPDITMIEDELTELSGKRLLNLTGVMNTELKMRYGAGNLSTMQDISDNFDRLTVLLVDYAKALMEKEMYKEAATVLQFGEDIGTDMKSNHELLSECLEKAEQQA